MSNQQDASLLTLKAIKISLAAHAVLIFTQDEIGRFFLRAFECNDESLVKGTRLESGKGLAGWILKNKQSIIVNDFDSKTSHLGYYSQEKEAQIKSFMGCPLKAGGILCVDSAQGSFFDNDLDLLHIYAQILGTQLNDAGRDADDEARRYFTRFEKVQELRSVYPKWQDYLPNFLQVLAQTTGFEHVCFTTIKEGGSSFTIESESTPLLREANMPLEFPLSGALAGWVFRNDVPVHTEGLDGSVTAPLYGKLKNVPQFQSVICLPISVNRATSAVLCLGGTEPRAIPQVLRSFVRMAADELVQYLETLYLRFRVRSLMPKAKVYHDGAHAFDPDSAPRNISDED